MAGRRVLAWPLHNCVALHTQRNFPRTEWGNQRPATLGLLRELAGQAGSVPTVCVYDHTLWWGLGVILGTPQHPSNWESESMAPDLALALWPL